MRMAMRKKLYLRNLNDARQCKMGLEIDFKDGPGCDLQREKRQRKVTVIVDGDVVIIIIDPKT